MFYIGYNHIIISALKGLKPKGLQRELLFSNHFPIIIRAKGFAIVEEIIMLLLQILKRLIKVETDAPNIFFPMGNGTKTKT